MKLKLHMLAAALAATTSGSALAQTIIYVDQSVPMSGTGTLTWSNAFQTLDEALNPATNPALNSPGGVDIRIAQGTYVPDGSVTFPTMSAAPRSATFHVTGGVVRMQGGFAGTELSTEPPSGSATILSGDIGVVGDPADNCFHTVVFNQGTDPESVEVDVFDLTIRDGAANSPATGGFGGFGSDAYGGGVLLYSSTVRLTRVATRDSSAIFGGGIAMLSDPATLVPANLRARQIRVRSNFARVNGSGLYASSGQVANIASSTFRDNLGAFNGGGIYIAPNTRDFEVVSTRIFDNSARFGGGIYSEGISEGNQGGHRIINCTIAFNVAADEGGGVYIAPSTDGQGNTFGMTHDLHNTILFSNTGAGVANGDNLFNALPAVGDDAISVTHSLLGPSAAASSALPSGSVFVDASIASGITPGWVNASARNFRLAVGSVCIDRGDDELLREDRSDIDDDGNLGNPVEVLPREFLMSDEANVSTAQTTREVFVQSAAGSFPTLIQGVDAAIIGPICDIGAFEHRILAASFQ